MDSYRKLFGGLQDNKKFVGLGLTKKGRHKNDLNIYNSHKKSLQVAVGFHRVTHLWYTIQFVKKMDENLKLANIMHEHKTIFEYQWVYLIS